MENIPKAFKEFEEFKYKNEEIFTKSEWDGDWDEDTAVFLICAEYVFVGDDDDPDNEITHINYLHKSGGSNRFNEWLEKYNLEFEWYDSCVGYVYLQTKEK